MQQTETYKLNKPEMSDLMSLAPLNENMDKLETALLAKTAETRTDGLEQRIVTLEGHKIAIGTYVGDGGGVSKPQFIDIGFTPRVVLTQRANAMCSIVFDNYLETMVLMEGGFAVASKTSSSYNSEGVTYQFAALT